MHAGSITLLEEPVSDPLESWFRNGGLPGLEVERTQSSFDDRPVQAGQAATRLETTTQSVDVAVDVADGDPVAIDVTSEPTMQDVVTEWVADVTGTGLIVPASVTGDDRFAFPYDLFMARTDRELRVQHVDVTELHGAWDRDDVLGDVWMTGSDHDDEGAEMKYHAAADTSDLPTFGLGFERPWNGTVARGVVYESGYVAVYNASSATEFIRFLEDELLAYTYEPDTDGEQATLASGEKECERCGRETDLNSDNLCVVCVDKLEEDGGEA